MRVRLCFSSRLLITSFSKVVGKNAIEFRKVFRNKNQYWHFLEYVTGLIVCEPRHWYLVLRAYSLLRPGTLDAVLNRWLNVNVGTIGERCRFACAEVLRFFILLVLKQDERHFDPNAILKNALSSGRQLKLASGRVCTSLVI